MAVFAWCLEGSHDQCRREYQKWHIVPNRKRGQPSTKIEYLDEYVKCECRKRGCPCYVKPTERTKTKARRKK